jgi:hypothetical protein
VSTLRKAIAAARKPSGKSFELATRTALVDTFVAAARRSRNPPYYWQAYQIARRLGAPIPEHVLRYFDRVARRLAQPQGRGSKDKYIARCLELQTGPGQRNPFMRRDDFEPHMFAVLRVAAGEKIDVVALDTRIARRELQA